MLYVGDDWAEGHHDVEVVNEVGRRLARARLPEGVEGITRLHALIAKHQPAQASDLDAGEAAGQVCVGIETDRGLWVQALVAAGYLVYPINPVQVARYRQRHTTSGAKSDPGDAHVLAEIVRLDRAHHRPLAGDSPNVEAIKLVARAHQSLIWERTRHLLRLRSALREFFPAALHAFDDLDAPDALELLTLAPDPMRAAALSTARIAAALRRANRRDITAKAALLRQRLRAPALGQPTPVQAAYAAIVATQVGLLTLLNAQIDQMADVVAEQFAEHRDADRYLSHPGLGVILAARMLGEFGDDPHRFADAKGRKNYAGSSPITRASGQRRVVLARHARNRHLGDAVHQWAFCSLRGSPGARAYYTALRDRGVGHQAALNQLANRLVGILHGCLKTDTTYDATKAWAHHRHDLEPAA